MSLPVVATFHPSNYLRQQLLAPRSLCFDPCLSLCLFDC